MFKLNESLFEKFKQCQEPHNDFKAINKIGGEVTETNTTNSRQFINQFGKCIGNACLNDTQMEQINMRDNLRRDCPHVRRKQLPGLDTFKQIGHQFDEAFIWTSMARIRTICGVGESGMGHYHGRDGFLTFSKAMPVMHQARLNGMHLFDPPYGRIITRLVDFLTRP